MIRRALLAALFLLCISSPAWALNCSSNPFTLTPGTTASATQVMANINNLLTCANTVLGKFTGPASSSSGDVLCFDGTTGQLGKACASGVWSTYTPTVTCLTGGPNLTSATITGEYLRLGRQITVNINVVVTLNGTCGGNWIVTAPVTAGGSFSYVLNLRNGVQGWSGNCGLLVGTTIMTCNKYDGGYPVNANGDAIAITGTYEAATN